MEGIKAIPFRTPACDRHLPDNESDECPWCEIEHMQKVIDRTAIQRLDLESENLRLTAENSELKKALNEIRNRRGKSVSGTQPPNDGSKFGNSKFGCPPDLPDGREEQNDG